MSFRAEFRMIDEPGFRKCGGCTLCCKLTPVEEIAKPANHRCEHQRSGKGCAIYAKRPVSCRLWSCMWLSDAAGTASLSRPDRVHYVIDVAPDYITVTSGETGERVDFAVLQVWVDPLYPDAHKDPALRAYIDAKVMPALIRYGRRDGFTLFPPSVTGAGWREQGSKADFTRQYSLARMMAMGLVEAQHEEGDGIGKIISSEVTARGK